MALAPLPLADATQIDIDANRRLLNRYRYIHHETMRVFAGWLPKAENFEVKCELARGIWESAEHVNALYLRLREIQSPAFKNPEDPALLHLMAEMLHAPNEFALLRACRGVLEPALAEAMRVHSTTTFPNTDFPSIYALNHIVVNLDEAAKRIAQLEEDWRASGRIDGQMLAWQRYTEELLAGAGGVTGDEPRPAQAPLPPSVRHPFVEAKEAGRDSRFINRQGDFGPRAGEDDYEGHTRTEFERYSTEMLAAETVAVVMFRLTGMPWGFQYDTARHLYDEVRHCLIGYDWMKRQGLDPFKAPQFLQVFQWRTRFDPVTQYCMLTMGNEVNAFPYRHRRIEAHEKSGDRYSEQQVRYDVADETQHVRFGKRWLPEMLKVVGETRPLDTYISEVLQVWEKEYMTGKLPIE